MTIIEVTAKSVIYHTTKAIIANLEKQKFTSKIGMLSFGKLEGSQKQKFDGSNSVWVQEWETVNWTQWRGHGESRGNMYPTST